MKRKQRDGGSPGADLNYAFKVGWAVAHILACQAYTHQMLAGRTPHETTASMCKKFTNAAAITGRLRAPG